MSKGTGRHYGVVVFIDMLGTKGMWKRKDVGKVLARYESLIEYYHITVKRNKELFGELPEFKMIAFSDTVVYTCSVPEEDKERFTDADLASIGTYNLHLLFTAALVAENYPRGAISLGWFYRLENMIVGPAIDEAAEYYKLPNWVGISAAPSLHYFLSNYVKGEVDPLKYFVRWDILLNNGIEKDGWALNWPKKSHYSSSKEYEKNFIKIQNVITEEMKSKDVSVALKWRNTDAFFRANNC